MPAGLAGEQRGHAVVPAAQAAAFEGIALVGDVEALAGRAHVGARAAGEALRGLFRPEVHVGETLFEAAGRLGQIRGGLLAGGGLFAGCLGFVHLVGAVGEFGRREEGFAFFGHGLKHEAAVHGREQHVGAGGIGGAAAGPVAEAGAARAVAGPGDDQQVVAAGLVVGVLELAFEERLVEHGEAAGVAGTAAEHHPGRSVGGVVEFHVQFGRIFRVFGACEMHERFTGGENGGLGGYGGAGQRRRFSGDERPEHNRFALLTRGQHLTGCRHFGQPRGQLVGSEESYGAHCVYAPSM